MSKHLNVLVKFPYPTVDGLGTFMMGQLFPVKGCAWLNFREPIQLWYKSWPNWNGKPVLCAETKHRYVISHGCIIESIAYYAKSSNQLGVKVVHAIKEFVCNLEGEIEYR